MIDYEGESVYKSFYVEDLRINRGRIDCRIKLFKPEMLYRAIREPQLSNNTLSAPGYRFSNYSTIKRIDLVNNRFALFKEKSDRSVGEFGIIIPNDNTITELEESLRTYLIHQNI